MRQRFRISSIYIHAYQDGPPFCYVSISNYLYKYLQTLMCVLRWYKVGIVDLAAHVKKSQKDPYELVTIARAQPSMKIWK